MSFANYTTKKISNLIHYFGFLDISWDKLPRLMLIIIVHIECYKGLVRMGVRSITTWFNWNYFYKAVFCFTVAKMDIADFKKRSKLCLNLVVNGSMRVVSRGSVLSCNLFPVLQ